MCFLRRPSQKDYFARSAASLAGGGLSRTNARPDFLSALGRPVCGPASRSRGRSAICLRAGRACLKAGQTSYGRRSPVAGRPVGRASQAVSSSKRLLSRRGRLGLRRRGRLPRPAGRRQALCRARRATLAGPSPSPGRRARVGQGRSDLEESISSTATQGLTQPSWPSKGAPSRPRV